MASPSVPKVLEPNPRFANLATDEAVQRTARALEKNGFGVQVAANGREALAAALALISEGSEVLTMTSQTLEAIGLARHLDESGRYQAIRKKLLQMDPKTEGRQMRKLAAAPDYVVGSVHAITEDGHVWIASNSGSQLAAYAYTGGRIIWVVGAQKIVPDDAAARQRLYEYSYPLEDERAQKAYGMRSGMSKVLVVNKELQPGRITIILVKEKLGF